MVEQTNISNNASGMPAGMPSLKIFGVYPQKQPGLVMQRIRVLGGRLTLPQWRTIVQSAVDYTNSTPLHITTRQDIELHNIPDDKVRTLLRRLSDAGLETFGAGGDSVRNLTVCAGCGKGFNVLPLAELVWSRLKSDPLLLSLPRKFKISFSGCFKACAKPWINDLGFIAQSDGRFTVVAAGSLGPKPSLAIELYRDFEASGVLPLCLASIQFFNQYGDRQNRAKARFRHIRENLGDDVFRSQLDAVFKNLMTASSWPKISLSKNDVAPLLCRLQLPEGNIAPVDAIALADAAESAQATLQINFNQSLLLRGKNPLELPPQLARLAVLPRITTCPGSVTCPRALVDCCATAEKISEALSLMPLRNIAINLSGCPNNCGQSFSAQIGLVGLKRTIDGRQRECYRVFTGGGNGRNNLSGQEIGIVEAQEIPDFIIKTVSQKTPDSN